MANFKTRSLKGSLSRHTSLYGFLGALNEIRPRESVYECPLDEVSLTASMIVIANNGEPYAKAVMSDVFLSQLLNKLQIPSGLISRLPLSSAISLVNDLISESVGTFVKIKLQSGTAICLVNPKITASFDRWFFAERLRHEIETISELMLLSHVDSEGRISRFMLNYPDMKKDRAMAGVEILIDDSYTLHPRVTPCIFSRNGNILLKKHMRVLYPSGSRARISESLGKWALDFRELAHDMLDSFSNMSKKLVKNERRTKIKQDLARVFHADADIHLGHATYMDAFVGISSYMRKKYSKSLIKRRRAELFLSGLIE